MKIYPRRIIILPDVSTYELNIKNSSKQELILLFRIKRSEKKVVTFGPKKGFVLPGETRIIPISLLHRGFVRTRLLVKLVAVSRAQVNSLDFEKTWQTGLKFKGEVKKIIDVIDSSANLETIIESKETSNDFDQLSDIASDISSISHVHQHRHHAPSPHHNNSAANLLVLNQQHHRNKTHDSRMESTISGYDLSNEFHSFHDQESNPSLFTPDKPVASAQERLQRDNSDSSFEMISDSALRFVKIMSQQLSASPKDLKTNLSQELPPEDIEKLASFFNNLSKTTKRSSEQQHLLPPTVHRSPARPRDLKSQSRDSDSQFSESNFYSDVIKPTPVPDGDEKMSVLTNEEEGSNLSDQFLSSVPPSDDNKKPAALPQARLDTTVQSLYSLPAQPQSRTVTTDTSRQSTQSHYSHHSQPSLRSQHSQLLAGQSLVSSIDRAPVENSSAYTGGSNDPPLHHSSFSPLRKPQAAKPASKKVIAPLTEKALEAFSTLIPQEVVSEEVNPKAIRMSGGGNSGSLALSQSLTGYQTYTLEIFNEHVQEPLLTEIIESRIIYAIAQRQKITTVNIQNTSEIHSLKKSLALAFTRLAEVKGNPKDDNSTPENVDDQEEDQKQLLALRTAYLEDHFHELQMEYTALFSLDASINRFQMLTSINLSHNQIKYIDGMILLPHLTYLDLSYNYLKSLDYLQSLTNLKTLLVHHNRIESFKQSINVIITLSNSLTTIDLSENPVCNDLRYAEEVILAFPKLRSFDQILLEKLYKSYTTNDAINKYKLQQAQQQLYPNKYGVKKTGPGGVLQNKLPEFPCILFDEERKLLSTSITNKSDPHQSQQYIITNEKRFDFIQKVKRALGLKAFHIRKERVHRQSSEEETGEEKSASRGGRGRSQTPTSSTSRNSHSFTYSSSSHGKSGGTASHLHGERIIANNLHHSSNAFSFHSQHLMAEGEPGVMPSHTEDTHESNHNNNDNGYYLDPMMMQSQESRLQYEIFQQSLEASRGNPVQNTSHTNTSNYNEGSRIMDQHPQSHMTFENIQFTESEDPFMTHSRSTMPDPSTIPHRQPEPVYYHHSSDPNQQPFTGSQEEKHQEYQQYQQQQPYQDVSQGGGQHKLHPQPTSYSPKHAARRASAASNNPNNTSHRTPTSGSKGRRNSSYFLRSDEEVIGPGVTAFDPVFQQSAPHFAQHTSVSKQVGRSNEDILIPHWRHHQTSHSAPTTPHKSTLNTTTHTENNTSYSYQDLRRTTWTPTTNKPFRSTRSIRSKSPSRRGSTRSGMYDDDISLYQETASVKKRRKSFGIHSVNDLDDANRTYHSDTEVSTRGRVTANLSRKHFKEMQEDPRYSIWHPRYRVPVPVFGFSKPFAHRPPPEQIGYAPLFDKTVQRIREGFEKLPTRGTFPRAAKGLTAAWYPMDYSDLEAIRRQGYFHETIGQTTKFSYQDFRSDPWEKESAKNNLSSNMSIVSSVNEAKLINTSGSTLISPQKAGRRGVKGAHISRMYKSSEGRIENTPQDDFSGYRKWHPDLIPTNNTHPLNASILLKSGSKNFNDTLTLNNSTIATIQTKDRNVMNTTHNTNNTSNTNITTSTPTGSRPHPTGNTPPTANTTPSHSHSIRPINSTSPKVSNSSNTNNPTTATTTINNMGVDPNYNVAIAYSSSALQYSRGSSPLPPGSNTSTSNSRRPSITSAITLDTGFDNLNDLLPPPIPSPKINTPPKPILANTGSSPPTTSTTTKKQRQNSALGQLFGLVDDISPIAASSHPPSAPSSGRGGGGGESGFFKGPNLTPTSSSGKKIPKPTNTSNSGNNSSTSSITPPNQKEFSSFFPDDHELIFQSQRVIEESSLDGRERERDRDRPPLSTSPVPLPPHYHSIIGDPQQQLLLSKESPHFGTTDSISYISSNASLASNSPKHYGLPDPTASNNLDRPRSTSNSPLPSGGGILRNTASNTSNNLSSHQPPSQPSQPQHYYLDNYSGDYVSSETLLRSLKVEKSHPATQPIATRAGIADAETLASNESSMTTTGNEMMASYLNWLQEQHLSQDTGDYSSQLNVGTLTNLGDGNSNPEYHQSI